MDTMCTIGVIKEQKLGENRVALTPRGVSELTAAGFSVFVQEDAGRGSGFSDEQYIDAGAILAFTLEEIYRCDIICAIKEPQAQEIPLIRRGQYHFRYLHLAGNKRLEKNLFDMGGYYLPYELIVNDKGVRPFLKIMSELAGKLSIQLGARFLEATSGGPGILLSDPSSVVVIGHGNAGKAACEAAVAAGANVIALDIQADDDVIYPVLQSSPSVLRSVLPDADLVVSTVLIPGEEAPKIITEEMIYDMKKGSVIVDISCDEGGTVEGAFPTTHNSPYQGIYGTKVISIPNLPSMAARTATIRHSDLLVPYLLEKVSSV